MDELRKYTTGEMIDKLKFNQLAILVDTYGSFISGEYVSLEKGNSLYYDQKDGFLKSTRSGEPIVLYKTKDDEICSWIIVNK